MKFVQPIKDIKKVSQIKNMLRGDGNIRDLLLFELWINSALRASDLLRIKIGDVFNVFQNARESFEIKEKKTGKRSVITITPKVKETLMLYRQTFPTIIENPDNFLFFAKKTFPLGSANIGRVQAWKIIQWVCHDVGLEGSYWTHSLRKSWWFQARQASVPIELIQHRLNHSSLAITKRYIWVTDDELEKVCNKLDL